ncbi:SlyX family protein [Herbaspirillum lusitanum]|uniref:SlyX family protein n=1 Tax=Herbaspirillum lusitanum TaxID=213312 RepID=UPI00030C81FD
MIDEERLVDIELKLTHQEDTVDALNKIVYEQQKKIDELEKLLTALARPHCAPRHGCVLCIGGVAALSGIARPGRGHRRPLGASAGHAC